MRGSTLKGARVERSAVNALRREVDAAALTAAVATGDERKAAIARHVALCRELSAAEREETWTAPSVERRQGELFG